MDRLQQAIALIHRAEIEIRGLIAAAGQAGEYGHAAELAKLAARLGAVATAGAVRDNPTDPETPTQNVPVPASSAARPQDSYPRFWRDGDSLVKTAWSPTDKCEYDHKAPNTAVIAVAEELDRASGTTRRKLVNASDILKTSAITRLEVRSYQIYVVLAWLRTAGLIEQEGRGGYRVALGVRLQDAVEGAFASLPTIR